MDIMTPFKTITITELKAKIANQLQQHQEFVDEFDRLNDERLAKIDEVKKVLKNLSITAPTEQNHGVFSSHQPNALRTFKDSIHSLAHNHLFELTEIEAKANLNSNKSYHISPYSLERLFGFFEELLPQDLKPESTFPTSYITSTTSNLYGGFTTAVIKDLWNFCLTLLQSEERIEQLADNDDLKMGEYSTPFFKLSIKVLSEDDEDFGELRYKLKIEFSPEINAILDENRSHFLKSEMTDDF